MKKHLWIVAVCGVLLIAIVVGVAQSQSQGQGQSSPAKPQAGGPPKMPPPLVAAELVIERDVHAPQTFVGTIMPKRVSSVGSAVDGRVVDFAVNEGDRVEQGQMLCQLLTGQLDIQLAGAKAELERRRHVYEELKTSWPEEVRQSESRHKARKAAMDYATAKMQRARSLHTRNQITDDQMQEAQSLADQAQQAYAESEAGLAIIKGPREQTVRQAEQNVAVQQEEVNAIQDQISKHTIKSPFAGYVVQEFTELGQWVAKAGLVAKVAELDEVDAEIMVLENYLPNMKLGMPATVEIPAIPGQAFQAQVAIIVPQADVRSRTFPVKVRIQNQLEADGQLLIKAGMLARVTLEVGNFGRGVLVPKDAVVLGGAKPIVYAVDPAPPEMAATGVGGVVRAVPVELGVEDGNLITARGDIKRGDRVVVQGNERLRPGAPVRLAQ